ncbi:PilZ domain-containing protein [Aliiglaciecola litoralis]|uniref:Cyclic diguanosine monophosphate-binding protein n=1 Tax=Aliiglaciecola litoralis TaxID=582857 RepID=A0ABN1LN12_9ALTE
MLNYIQSSQLVDEVMEKRQFNRVIFTAPAILKQDNMQWQTNIIDVSLKGALVAYPDDFQADLERDFELTIEMQGANHHIVMSGNIAHSANHCVGFKVHHMALDSMTELRRIVELNLGDEALLQRDLKALTDS